MAVSEHHNTTVAWFKDLLNILVLHNSLTLMDDKVSLNGHIIDHSMTMSSKGKRKSSLNGLNESSVLSLVY